MFWTDKSIIFYLDPQNRLHCISAELLIHAIYP